MLVSIRSRQAATIAAGYLGSLVLYRRLPSIYVARHPMPLGRQFVAFLLPTAALLTYVLLQILWARDPVRSRGQHVQTTFDAIVFRVLLFITAIHTAVVCGLLSVAGVLPPVAPMLARAVPALLGLAFVGVGNLLPRMRPNVVIGLRTSRTLSDEAVWRDRNRVAGYVSVALGAVLIGTGAFIAPSRAAAPVAGAAGLTALAALFVHSRTRSGV
jgi:uncharacterized membrane protein